MKTDIIQIKRVSRVYQNGNKLVKALDDITLDITVEKGIKALIGKNGAGKTTLIKIIAGLYCPSAGEIYVNDEPLTLKWTKKNISLILSGEKNLYYRNTVFENALYYAKLKKIKTADASREILQIAKELDCENILDKWVENISSGERKKASLLAGLAAKPKLIIIDEPTWGLDVASVKNLKKLLSNIAKERDVCIITSSHDTYFLSEIADSYFYIDEGKCKREYHNPLNVDELINILSDGKLEDRDV